MWRGVGGVPRCGATRWAARSFACDLDEFCRRAPASRIIGQRRQQGSPRRDHVMCTAMRDVLPTRRRLARLAQTGEQLGVRLGRFARELVLPATTGLLVLVLALYAGSGGAGSHWRTSSVNRGF